MPFRRRRSSSSAIGIIILAASLGRPMEQVSRGVEIAMPRRLAGLAGLGWVQWATANLTATWRLSVSLSLCLLFLPTAKLNLNSPHPRQLMSILDSPR